MDTSSLLQSMILKDAEDQAPPALLTEKRKCNTARPLYLSYTRTTGWILFDINPDEEISIIASARGLGPPDHTGQRSGSLDDAIATLKRECATVLQHISAGAYKVWRTSNEHGDNVQEYCWFGMSSFDGSYQVGPWQHSLHYPPRPELQPGSSTGAFFPKYITE